MLLRVVAARQDLDLVGVRVEGVENVRGLLGLVESLGEVTVRDGRGQGAANVLGDGGNQRSCCLLVGSL